MSLAFLRDLDIEYQIYRKQLDANLTLTARYACQQERVQARNTEPEFPDTTRHRDGARKAGPRGLGSLHRRKLMYNLPQATHSFGGSTCISNTPDSTFLTP
jgi:hypothetical protein